MSFLVLWAHVMVVVVYLARCGVTCWSLNSRHTLLGRALSTAKLELRVNRKLCRAGHTKEFRSPVAPSAMWGRQIRNCLQAAYKDTDNISRASDNDDEANNDNGKARGDASTLLNSDWFEAELTLRSAPEGPHPKIVPHQLATLCCRSLQWIDYPAPNAGLRRCYRFFTPECRKLVTGRQYSSSYAESVESFCQYAVLSPALQPFMGATRVEVGQVTVTRAQPPARGALASFSIVIRGAPVLSVQHASGMARGGVASSPPTTHMVMRLEEQRRPPHQGCWMVREIMDVRHAFAGDMGNAHVGA